MFKETDHLFFSEPLVLVLLYTSFCGTCEMAKRMLAVLSQTVKDVAFYQMNANLHPAVLKQYDVRSIPCFLIFKNGRWIDQFYAFYSVSFLYDKLQAYSHSET